MGKGFLFNSFFIDEKLIQNHYGCVKAISEAQGNEYYLEFLIKVH